MSTPLLLGVYQPGSTVLHRLPVWVKVVGLGALSLTIVLVRDVRAGVAFLALALVVAATGKVALRALARSTRGILLIAVVASALQWWAAGPAKAAETLLDLITLALLALTVTATTPVNAILDSLIRGIGPLRRVGVDPERVALTIGLAIQAIPGTVALALETRDAARARGLGRHPRAYLTPFVIRVVARAHETGDALAARGVGDD